MLFEYPRLWNSPGAGAEAEAEAEAAIVKGTSIQGGGSPSTFTCLTLQHKFAASLHISKYTD
jgi:hypothetical protein